MDESSAQSARRLRPVELDSDASAESTSETPLASAFGRLAHEAAGASDAAASPPEAEAGRADQVLRASRAQPPDAAGQWDPLPFGKYRLLEELSRTPNSVVYRAMQDDMHGREVALKVLVQSPQADADSEEDDDDRAARFRREVENVARLRHPNIVSVYEIGEADGYTYFSMEYVPGCSLAQWIAEHGPMSGREAAELIFKVARAIHYAHTRGIIHRDIKPANILLDRVNGEPMVADFGLAKDIRSDVRITQSGVTVGTPPYMPPEQARGQHDALDSRSDVYALGATLYELVTGRPPFDGETGLQVMMRVLEKSPTRPRRLKPSLSPDLESVILKCLAKRQRERYDNAELLAQDLARYLRSEWVHARKATLVHRVGRFLKTYRDIAYVLLAITVVYAVHLAGQYVTGSGAARHESVPLLHDGTQAAGWEPLRGNVVLYQPVELWLNNPTGDDTPDELPRDAAGRAAQEAVAISKEPLQMRDFELRFHADIIGRVPEPWCEPTLGVFLVPDAEAAQVPPGAWPPIREGYLFLLGARENTRTTLYRVERCELNPAGPGRAVALLEEPRLRLGDQNNKYDIAVGVVGSRLSLDVRDVAQRQRWRLAYTDDFPLMMPATSRVGLFTVGTTVLIERWSLAALSWQEGSPWLDRPDGLFQAGHYDEALRYYQHAQLFARDDAVLAEHLQERIALTREALATNAPLTAAPAYDALHQQRGSLRASRRLVECYVRGGLGAQALAVFSQMSRGREEGIERLGDADHRWLVPAGRRWADALARRATSAWPWGKGDAWLPRREHATSAAPFGNNHESPANLGGLIPYDRLPNELAPDTFTPDARGRHTFITSPTPLDNAGAAVAIYRDTRRSMAARTLTVDQGSLPHDLLGYVELLQREAAVVAWLAHHSGEGEAAMRSLRSELVGTQVRRWLYLAARHESPQVLLSMLRKLRQAHAALGRPAAHLALLTRVPNARDVAGTTRVSLLDELAASRLPRARLQAFGQEILAYVDEHDLHQDPLLRRLEDWLASLSPSQTLPE